MAFDVIDTNSSTFVRTVRFNPIFSAWSACQDGWEPGCPWGHDPTEEAAIADLLEQLQDQE